MTPARRQRAPWHRVGRRWRHSIRWRLVTLFLLLALATTGVFVLGSQRVLQGAWQGFARPLVVDYFDRLAAEIGSPPDPARAQALVQRLPLSVRIEGPVVQFDSHPGTRHRRWGDPWQPAAGNEGWGWARQTADGHRIVFGVGEPAPGARPRIVGWLTLGLLLVLTGIAYHGVRKLLRPLDDIGAGAHAFGQGDFSRPIPVRRRDELGDLAQRINDMATNLHGMLEAKRTLLLAISHELRSPLTRARLHAELIDDSEARQGLLRDLGEMRDLINDLLESERLAEGHPALHAESMDLEPWLSGVFAELVPQGDLVLAIDAPLQRLQADPARLRVLLRNLVGNTRRHAGAAPQPAEVFARRRAGDARDAAMPAPCDEVVEIGVRDHGSGVSPEQLAQLAQPFYRTDAARQRQTGGVGLGLHLCRSIAQAHGGRLVIERAEPGLRVTAVLPAD
jgi:signal transduction histidine kinase